MKRTIEFGKIDYNGSGRKNCPVTVDIELRDLDGVATLSICGDIWNPKRTDIYCGGQCLDEIKKYFATNMLFMEIYKLWEQYHLNTMHAGTEEQEAALANFSGTYDERVQHLKELNLYEVPYNGKFYRYGSAWLTRTIPENVLTRIKTIINNNQS